MINEIVHKNENVSPGIKTKLQHTDILLVSDIHFSPNNIFKIHGYSPYTGHSTD